MDEWKSARSPNYDINKDKLYPYSELPHLDYKLVKIPFCNKNLIEHIDYFGQGIIDTGSGIVGFSDCYNVNLQYKLVWKGPDKNKKIPNRIPLFSEDHSTFNYIKDNSVVTVTISNYTRWNILKASAQDIARIVNSDFGKVIVYGYNNDDSYNLIHELKLKQLFYCPLYTLPDKLQQTYFYTCYAAYLSLTELKKELYNNVIKGEYEAAIILTGCLTDVYCCNALGDIATKLLENDAEHFMVYAYKLWQNNGKDIVSKYFPAVFKLIFNGDCMTIINKEYNQALTLLGDPVHGWGNNNKTSKFASWKILPFWEDEKLLFKLYNIHYDVYLSQNYPKFYGEKDSNAALNTFNLEPIMMNGDIAFQIVNDDCTVVLNDKTDSLGNRQLLGCEEDMKVKTGYRWILATWDENVGIRRWDECKQNGHNCIDC